MSWTGVDLWMWLFCLFFPCLAIGQAASGNPVYQVRSNEVIVDVVVTDEHGPVRGLKAQDFSVSEDKKPQAINFFERHTQGASSAEANLSIPQLPVDVYTNVPSVLQADSVNVLLIDAVNTPPEDLAYARDQLIVFLKNMRPDTRTAIFTLGDELRFVQGFTSDTQTLLRALTDVQNAAKLTSDVAASSSQREGAASLQNMPGSDRAATNVMAAFQNLGRYEERMRIAMTLDALSYIARYLDQVPGRKNLIWFANSFPVELGPEEGQFSGEDAALFEESRRRVIQMMTHARIAIYPIAAQGLTGRSIYDASQAISSLHSLNSALTGRINTGSPFSPDANNIPAMNRLAEETGGKAFYNNNDLATAVQRAIDHGSDYYTLAYTPTNEKMNGKYRRVEVGIADKNDSVYYRRGYLASEMGPEPAPENPLLPLLHYGLPDTTQILYAVRVRRAVVQPGPGTKMAGKNSKLNGPVVRLDLDFAIRCDDIKLQATAQKKFKSKIEIELIAYGLNGESLNWNGETETLNINAATYASIQKSGVPAHLEIDVPKGRAINLSTGVYDWETAQAGTLQVRLESDVGR